MAEWVVDGEPGLDLWALDIARFDRSAGSKYFVGKRMEESVADLFRMHWPYKQAEAGRNIRRSAFHRQFAEAGAVFGAPTGWERPLWFAPEKIPSPTPPHKGEGLNAPHLQSLDLAKGVPKILSPLVGEMAGRPEGVFATPSTPGREFPYSMGRQHWWPMAEREAKAMAEGVGLFELSPFAKIDVQGRDALALVNYLCANQIDVAEGSAAYTQMLNARGGIEADITVTRFGETHFRIISGAATRQKDLAWIGRHAEDRGLDVVVSDVTSSEAVLAVMGPRSRELLQSLTDADLSNEAFPFATSRRLDIGMANARATRVSFVGELGFELYVATELAESLLAAIAGAGERFGLAYCGHYALDGCRLEKGYRHWGHDIGPKETPLEAGLGFAVAWKKTGFIGEETLRKQREAGVTKRLMHFAVEDAHPLLLHDEPIYRDGRYAGLTTSGGQGFRTGLTLCLGYIACEPGEMRETLLQSDYEIAVAGERYRLKPLAAPPYDAAGQRLRS
jgi:4-methylaminobutanoate oxidase (formaldehyde-forming)